MSDGAGTHSGLCIGVISDTHGLLRPELLDVLHGVDHILHAGDIGRVGIVEALANLAPVTAIRGNVDRGGWAAVYPHSVTVALGRARIHMLHDVTDLDPAVLRHGIDVVVTGHSHRPAMEMRGNTLFLNPGSAGPRRFRLPVTYASLSLSDALITPCVHHLMP